MKQARPLEPAETNASDDWSHRLNPAVRELLEQVARELATEYLRLARDLRFAKRVALRSRENTGGLP